MKPSRKGLIIVFAIIALLSAAGAPCIGAEEEAPYLLEQKDWECPQDDVPCAFYIESEPALVDFSVCGESSLTSVKVSGEAVIQITGRYNLNGDWEKTKTVEIYSGSIASGIFLDVSLLFHFSSISAEVGGKSTQAAHLTVYGQDFKYEAWSIQISGQDSDLAPAPVCGMALG